MNFDTLVQIAVGLFIVGLIATIFYEKNENKDKSRCRGRKIEKLNECH
jgi:hypothetical protein